MIPKNGIPTIIQKEMVSKERARDLRSYDPRTVLLIYSANDSDIQFQKKKSCTLSKPKREGKEQTHHKTKIRLFFFNIM